MKNFYCTFTVMLLLFMFSSGLIAAGEHKDKDYLVPVRAIREKIRSRLNQPVKTLDIDLIMEGNDFFGFLPYYVRWDSDSSRFWFQWKRWDETEKGTFEYDLKTASLRRLSKEEAERVPSYGAVWDNSRRRALWTVNDTLWLYDGTKKKSCPIVSGIGSTAIPPDYVGDSVDEVCFYAASFPFRVFRSGVLEPVSFSEDGTRAVLFYNNNLFALTLPGSKVKNGSGLIEKLTDIRTGKAPKEEPPTEAQRWLKKEQLKFFDVLQRRHNWRSKEKVRREQNNPAPFYLDGWGVYALLPSPDLKYAVLMLSRDLPGGRQTIVPDFVTSSGYTGSIPSYRQAGDESFEVKSGIIDLAGGKVSWINFGLGDRELDHYYFYWNPDSKRAVVSVAALNKEHNKHRWLAVVKTPAKPGEKITARIIAYEYDDAYITHAAMTYFDWLPDGENVWFVSERSGWMHVHTVSARGGKVKALTRGDYLLIRPRLTPDRKSMIFYATVSNPFEMYTYIQPLQGGRMRQLTSGMGRAEGILSPDSSRLAVIASNSNQPWELYVKGIDEPGVGKKVTDSPSPAFKSYPWIDPRIVFFKSEDGTQIPARLYLPAKTHPKKPAVIFAHGAGWLHNVHRWWAAYSQEYCFHHYLLEHGYTVLDIDFRGSAGYGRDWRTAVYGEFVVGKVSDVVDGAKYLVREHSADFERIGIYGGSGGGMVTLMALFTAPKYFGAGAALRSLPDVAHHHSLIHAWITKASFEDPGAYKRSSPIYYAEGLEDPLLICHPVVDTNAHFGGIMRLVQRLIELRKTNWELAVYPVENHGFVESSSWSDEYRRIFKLFEENLKK